MNELKREKLRAQVEVNDALKQQVYTQVSITKQQQENRTKLEEEYMRLEKKEMRYKSRLKHASAWLKIILLGIFSLLMAILLTLSVYKIYRVAVDGPMEVEKQVDVIPDECTQIRRNGKVYVSCDGVTVNGASTISESGVKNIPDLITQ